MMKFPYKKSVLALALIWGAPSLTAYTQESPDTVCYTPAWGSDAGKRLCMSAQQYSARNNGKTPPASYYLKKKVDVAEHPGPASSAPGEQLVNATVATPAPPPAAAQAPAAAAPAATAQAPAAAAPRIAAAVESAPARVPATPSTNYVLKRPNLEAKESAAVEPALAEPDRLATEAVKLMWERKLSQASAKINAALRLRVDRSYYHLVNGLIYHLQARSGENSAYDLAEQGYRQAINFDNSNWQAKYFAGLLSIDTSKFDVARQHLADALYLHPDDPALLNSFAYAAYRSGAPDQAAGAINAMEAMGGAQTAAELRNAAVIMAAVGEKEKAQSYLDRLRTVSDERVLAQVERRVKEWRDVHSQPGFLKAQFAPTAGPAGGFGGAPADAPGGVPAAAPGTDAPGGAAVGGAPGAVPGGGFDGAPGGIPGGPPQAAPLTAPGTEHKMVVVDVVLIATEEDFSNAMGVNLLRGLQIQFGTGGASFAYQRVSTDNGAGSSTTTIARNLTIPSVTYSLNIFNSNNVRDEILARPTLVAMAGRTSEFFSGVELNAVVVNSSNNSSASPVSIQKEIGTSLSVTPHFLADGRISMKVVAQRTFIRTPNANLTGFDARVETTKSKVDASVVMRPGETLILGGLSEKEGERIRDGVPLLQDVPVLQYLFARASTRDYQKSMLILITPRPPQYVYQPEKARLEYEKTLTEDERPFASLRARYADWFRPYPNWASVFHHLQENALWREFRTGDVVLENWSDMRSLKDRLHKVLDFLYY